ncbi:hypothetical protein AVEN_21265-1 [Araneus ventricosus]|uniref:Uncharacterized protein n=1 Tax=Araneus ventricosus TaxID=182803 RepID=A0A4Y1ZT06_ARAVE|nr:hypothetical protein AVEN_21265-1 [Araneus ventricosus]
MVFETASAGRNDSQSEQRLYLKSIESSTSPHEHPLTSNKNSNNSDTRATYALLKKLNRSVQRLNDASLSYTTGRTGPSYFKTDPKIQHSNNYVMIGIRSKVFADRKSTSLFPTPPQLKSSFSHEQGPPQLKSSFSHEQGPPQLVRVG